MWYSQGNYRHGTDHRLGSFLLLKRKKIMVKGENRAADRGRSRSTVKRNAPAETLGPDGGQLTPKSVSGAAEGRAGKEKPTHDLFPSKMVKTGGEAGADDVGAQDKGATSGSTGGETLHTTRPAQGAPAGEQAGEGPASAAAWDRARAANKRTWLDNRQDNGDLGDMAQQDRTTLVTASAIFNRLGYSTENGAKANRWLGIQDRGDKGHRPDAKDNGKPGTGGTVDRP